MAATDKDLEVEAMGQIAAALEPLDNVARERVIRWAVARFSGSGHAKGSKEVLTKKDDDPSDVPQEPGEFVSLARPTTDADYALVMGYWFQEIQGAKVFDAQRVNAELKNLGHRLGNITRAFDSLIDRKPQLVIQVQKTGKSKQARKLYKLTEQGKATVKQMRSNTENAQT